MNRLPASVLLTVMTFSACAHREQPPSPAPTPQRVATVAASEGTVTPRVLLAGIIAPTLSVGLQSALAEPADEITVREGQLVTRGQVLARLDTADLQAALDAALATAQSNRAGTAHNVYAGSLAISQGVDALRSAQANTRQAQANLSRDRTNLERYTMLLAGGYVAQQQVDQARTMVRTDEEALRSAQASVQSARANVTANGTLTTGGLQSSTLEQARANERIALAQAEQARVQIGKALITSPIDGVVVNRNLNPGEYPGSRQIFTIQKVDPIYAILHGSGEQIAHIAQGAQASVSVSDLGGRTFSGQVVAVLNQIIPGSTNFEVKVQLPNSERTLRPGMTAAGTVLLPTSYGIRIPNTAFTDDTHTSILTVDATQTVRATRVREREHDADFALVTGLRAGTQVITDGQTSASEGRRVSVR